MNLTGREGSSGTITDTERGTTPVTIYVFVLLMVRKLCITNCTLCPKIKLEGQLYQ